jgi:hypothetical protein
MTLDYYMHDGPTAFRFELEGRLDHEGARRLDQDWRTASSVIGDRRLIVDMTFVTDVDESARELLARWHAEGAQLVANSKASRALAESILGEPLPEPPPNARRAGASHTWLPFHVLLPLVALLFSVNANAVKLKSETIAAWNDYIQSANANLQNRVHPGGSFLWTFEDSGRADKVRSGEIVVAPAPGPSPKKLPGGLIHHWIGAVFVPGLELNQILSVTREYDRYKEFYRPSVIESKTIATNGAVDEFSMRIMNKAFFLKTALDADYRATTVRLDDRRSYSVSETTRVQEIEDYGQPGEHRIPEGEGGGLIWKLYSIARFEQRDGGVYVELEAIALSREIPAALRFFVDPIVRRVSRNSLFTSLQQTGQAVNSAGTSASAGQMRVAPSLLSNRSAAFIRVH